MTLTPETGHAINAGNLHKTISFAEGIGTSYNPSNPEITVPALKATSILWDKSLAQVNLFAAAYLVVVNNRYLILLPLDKLLTKVYNAAASSQVSVKFIDDVRNRIKKLKGIRISPKIKIVVDQQGTPTDKTINQISASQTGIDHVIDHLDGLIQVLLLEPGYAPSETDITTTALLTLLTAIKSANQDVIDAFPALDNARIARDELLYKKYPVGLDLAGKVKKYIRSVFGGDSREYHQVAKLKFTRPRK